MLCHPKQIKAFPEASGEAAKVAGEVKLGKHGSPFLQLHFSRLWSYSCEATVLYCAAPSSRLADLGGSGGFYPLGKENRVPSSLLSLFSPRGRLYPSRVCQVP